MIQVAYESFDYAVGGVGGNNGGSGWFSPWWAGTSQGDGVVVAGSVDAVGNQFNTSEQWAGSFRQIDTLAHTAIAPNGKFGSVDSTIWIRFGAGRVLHGHLWRHVPARLDLGDHVSRCLLLHRWMSSSRTTAKP